MGRKIKNIFILLKSVLQVPKTLVTLFYILNSEKNTFNTYFTFQLNAMIVGVSVQTCMLLCPRVVTKEFQ